MNYFRYGVIILAVAILATMLYKHLRKAKTMREVIAVCCLFLAYLAGIVLIIISFTVDGHGFGIKKNDDVSVPSDSISWSVHPQVSATIEDVKRQIDKNGELIILIYGDKVYFNNYACKDLEELERLVQRYYSDSLGVNIVDDYAEDAVFEKVISLLDKSGITQYQIMESEKG